MLAATMVSRVRAYIVITVARFPLLLITAKVLRVDNIRLQYNTMFAGGWEINLN